MKSMMNSSRLPVVLGWMRVNWQMNPVWDICLKMCRAEKLCFSSCQNFLFILLLVPSVLWCVTYVSHMMVATNTCVLNKDAGGWGPGDYLQISLKREFLLWDFRYQPNLMVCSCFIGSMELTCGKIGLPSSHILPISITWRWSSYI